MDPKKGLNDVLIYKEVQPMCRIHLFWNVCKGSRIGEGGLFSPSVFCQAIAELLAKLCQSCGKLLPTYWQDSATLLARLCHLIGKSLPLHCQNEAAVVTLFPNLFTHCMNNGG